jgi:hypothetical protein
MAEAPPTIKGTLRAISSSLSIIIIESYKKGRDRQQTKTRPHYGNRFNDRGAGSWANEDKGSRVRI